MDIYLVRTSRGLEAQDEEAKAVLRRIKPGAMVLASISRPRNLAFHRRFFGMCKVVYDCCGGNWSDPYDVVRELKYHIGHVDKQRIVDRQTGEVLADIVIPRSIKFSAMDQAEFENFVERCIQVICTKMVPGIEDQFLRDEVLKAVA